MQWNNCIAPLLKNHPELLFLLLNIDKEMSFKSFQKERHEGDISTTARMSLHYLKQSFLQ